MSWIIPKLRAMEVQFPESEQRIIWKIHPILFRQIQQQCVPTQNLTRSGQIFGGIEFEEDPRLPENILIGLGRDRQIMHIYQIEEETHA